MSSFNSTNFRCYIFYDGFGVPALYVTDPELIQRITIKDFNYFVDMVINPHFLYVSQ